MRKSPEIEATKLDASACARLDSAPGIDHNLCHPRLKYPRLLRAVGHRLQPLSHELDWIRAERIVCGFVVVQKSCAEFLNPASARELYLLLEGIEVIRERRRYTR
jgi:hypothetical protein